VSYLRNRYWFGLAREFISSFFRSKIERRGGILLGDKAEGYGGGGMGQPSNRLNITKLLLKAKKKGKSLLSTKLICRCVHCLKYRKIRNIIWTFNDFVSVTETIHRLMYWKTSIALAGYLF
jgi:hypothetical protein